MTITAFRVASVPSAVLGERILGNVKELFDRFRDTGVDCVLLQYLGEQSTAFMMPRQGQCDRTCYFLKPFPNPFNPNKENHHQRHNHLQHRTNCLEHNQPQDKVSD